MPIKRSFYLGRIVVSFLIATAVFFLIFALADTVSYLNYQNTANQNRFIQNALDEFSRNAENISCDDITLRSSLTDLDHVGSYIGLLERRFGLRDPRVVAEKKLYLRLQLQHFLIIKEMNARCDSQFEPILFFYSNDPDYIDASQFMGGILGAFKERDSAAFMVYSFDVSIGDSTASSLAQRYNVTVIPSVVLGEKEILRPNNIDELIRYFS